VSHSSTSDILDTTVPAELYRERRRRLMDQIGTGVALINSSGFGMPRLWDKNTQYLTGLFGKDVYLLLAPDGVAVDHVESMSGPELGRGYRHREILFVPEPPAYNARFFGEGADFDGIRRSTGVDAVFGRPRMRSILEAALIESEELWLNTPTGGAQFQLELEPADWIDELRRTYYWVSFRNISSRIHAMRRVKHPYEIACLRRAYEVQTEIYSRIMRSLQPGANDSLGVSIYLEEITIRGPEYAGAQDEYPAQIIVASGPNTSLVACFDNDRNIADRDLVLIDSGVAFRGYSSDISRTFPANGVFTARQRELYAIVLEAQKAAIATVRPGSTQLEAHRAVNDVYRAHGVERYNGYAACGHDVGLNIHDAVTGAGYDLPLEPGVTFSLEPMLMLPGEGLGIRIEDGVVVTEDGCEVMPGPPKEIDEVEALCRRA